MMKVSSKVAVIACHLCEGFQKQMIPEIQLKFGESVCVLPVSCPGALNPLSYISFLNKGWGGLVVLCPKDACCCPQKVKTVSRQEVVKSLLPIFDVPKEKLEILTVTPFELPKVFNAIAKLLTIIEVSSKINCFIKSFSIDDPDLTKNILH